MKKPFIMAGVSLAFIFCGIPNEDSCKDIIIPQMTEIHRNMEIKVEYTPWEIVPEEVGTEIIGKARKMPEEEAEKLARTLLDAATDTIEYPFLLAIIETESRFNANAISPAGAIGLGQLMPTTAQYVAKKAGIEYDERLLKDPEYNVRLSVKYLERLAERYHNDMEMIAAAYNGGPGGACRYKGWREGKWGKAMVPKETISYVAKVMKKYGAYKGRINLE